MKSFFSFVLVGVLLLPLEVQAKNIAAKTYHFAQNDTIVLPLSSVNTNRLVVKGDKIINVHCPQSFCVATGNKRDQSGSISLKINIALPFTAHVVTEKGRNFSLFVNPKAVPAVVTEFIPNYLESEQSVFKKDMEYPLALGAFTKQMIEWQRSKKPIPGFNLHPIDPKTLPADSTPLAVIPQTLFSGRPFSGIIYQVKNQSNKAVTLTEAQFYSYSSRSASLDAYHLAPGESTHLYIVTGGQW
ncbi:type-F conjugative transfer system secretin TraK [Vibrio parahaemolyticus]|uniref:Type-F conjugative transfer system secretin TraK n=1 Tax=Vibrio parahaemolyticus TaxID=670 RepID=A0A9Q3UFF4_VIBPH|nr:type-F conjugative transfer system secretin TraK [Vibrio parahaemolyticus]EGQ8101941.1 type-F conjugative transfer system secretin TraK [Vibrio parahaemolyticus]EGQ8548726.1 type-F conjugative transfer system secretin TraK [Vibrio parahaemolyticus]EGQ9073825.1 type-F conjugative transfer system secretin TraK [Vibrio parahaemolyticus]EGQ9129648.1 type-F conjugative transfer system secretin TraK [Vibrio parahaemolyticus]EGQ9286407.1 type-F conjugative transfer system secretin TraK [Vibrio par